MRKEQSILAISRHTTKYQLVDHLAIYTATFLYESHTTTLFVPSLHAFTLLVLLELDFFDEKLAQRITRRSCRSCIFLFRNYADRFSNGGESILGSQDTVQDVVRIRVDFKSEIDGTIRLIRSTSRLRRKKKYKTSPA